MGGNDRKHVAERDGSALACPGPAAGRRRPPMSRGAPVTVSLPPAPDAILTAADVAAWLKITPRQVQRLGVPCVRLGPRTPRYLARDVLAWLEAQRQVPAPRRRRWAGNRRRPASSRLR